jgi:hypothetical protein
MAVEGVSMFNSLRTASPPYKRRPPPPSKVEKRIASYNRISVENRERVRCSLEEVPTCRSSSLVMYLNGFFLL